MLVQNKPWLCISFSGTRKYQHLEKGRKTQIYMEDVTTRIGLLCCISCKCGWAWDLLSFYLFFSPRGEWAVPGGTAIPGQPVAKAEQAPDSSPSSKNQFNIEVPRWGTYQILS